MELVNIKNLSFEYFDNKILHNINMSIQEGEKILLIGPNGAGKSTLLRLIAGLHMSRQYENFNVLGTISPSDQFKGLAYLGNRWQRNISFCGVSPYMADIKAGDMMKKWQLDNIERRNELVNVLVNVQSEQYKYLVQVNMLILNFVHLIVKLILIRRQTSLVCLADG
jgi:ABC-type Mn2+/Zn2+ transport system ATPase subunit